MKVLMYGWEFPPKNNGGLGVACEGIVNGLLANGLKVHLVLPTTDFTSNHGNLNVSDASKVIKKIGTQNIAKTMIKSAMVPYQTESEYEQYLTEVIQTKRLSQKEQKELYGQNLYEEVERYAHVASELAKDVEHDVIHAHDWMTYKAAIKAKEHSGKPMIAHIHATEFDRTGGHPNQYVYDIEKLGLQYADKVIAVSELTKNKIAEHYGVDPEKIEVVHNAITKKTAKIQQENYLKIHKTVLFLGRMTIQKGPDLFLNAAKRALEFEPDTKFIMAGDGDMMAQIIHQAHELGIERNVIFTGFLKGDQIEQAYKSADLFVMPSTSEPFGLTALEAIHNGTPVLISKQSGAAEVIRNALKVDFWDTEEMTNKIVTVLRHKPLQETLSGQSQHDLSRLNWPEQARLIHKVYKQV